jgi:hypothetical protein
MAINLTSFTKSVDNIQKLSDKPNETDGLSAQGLKEKFDRAALDIKSFINGTLLKELESHLNTQSTSIGNNKTKIEEVKNSLDTLNDDYGITKDLVSQKINIYELSSTKVDTGKRKDEKIVYSISIPVTLSNTEITIDLTELNIKKIVTFGGAYSDEENTIPYIYYVKFNYADVGPVEYFVSTSIYKNKIYIRNSQEYAGLSGELILEYTEKGE